MSAERTPIVLAHRGASAEAPENTIEAFRLARDLGADTIETDAQMTDDGYIVLAHDETGERMAGIKRPICRASLSEVKRWDAGHSFRGAGETFPFRERGIRVPTLEEALSELPDVSFNVDAKQRTPDMIPTLLALLGRLGAERRVRIASFSSRRLARVRALGYKGETGLGQAEVVRLRLLPEAVLRLVRLGGNAVQIPTNVGALRLDSAAFIARCHRLGLRVDYWTIDDPREARRLLANGADGIVTNDVRAMVPVVRAAREK